MRSEERTGGEERAKRSRARFSMLSRTTSCTAIKSDTHNDFVALPFDLLSSSRRTAKRKPAQHRRRTSERKTFCWCVMVGRSAQRTSHDTQNACDERRFLRSDSVSDARARVSFIIHHTVEHYSVGACASRRYKKLLHSTLRLFTIRFRHIQGRAHLARRVLTHYFLRARLEEAKLNQKLNRGCRVRDRRPAKHAIKAARKRPRHNYSAGAAILLTYGIRIRLCNWGGVAGEIVPRTRTRSPLGKARTSRAAEDARRPEEMRRAIVRLRNRQLGAHAHTRTQRRCVRCEQSTSERKVREPMRKR